MVWFTDDADAVGSSNITALIPPLIGLLIPRAPGDIWDDEEFEAVVEALEEIMSGSSFTGGAGSKTLTEPLLVWCERYGTIIVDRTLRGMPFAHLT